jgi:hypothetical protein
MNEKDTRSAIQKVREVLGPRPGVVFVPLAVGAGLAVVVAAACTSSGVGECERTEARCDGNIAHNCYFEIGAGLAGEWVWDGTDCGDRVCQAPHVLLNGEWRDLALCTVSPEPDALCQADRELWHMTQHCDGAAIATCEFGYHTWRAPCDSGTTCFMATASDSGPTCPGDPFCGVAPEPACGPTVASACVNGQVVACTCGVAVSREACPSDSHCATGFLGSGPSALQTASCQPNR